MKKILYFLIGFSISLFTINYVYAIGCYDPYTSGTTNLNNYQTTYARHDATGTTTTYSAAGQASSWAYDNFLAWKGPGFNKLALYCVYSDTTNKSGFWLIRYISQAIPNITTIAFWSFTDGIQYTYDRCILDGDGDGIPDSCDLYASDATPYQWAKLSHIEDRSTHAIVAMKIKTDRDDIFDYGTRPTDMTNYMEYISIAPVMQNSSELCTNTTVTGDTNGPSTQTPTAYSDEVNANVNAAGTADADSSATGLTPGTNSNGTETGDAALREIITNTGKTATNIDRLGDYLADINNSIKQINIKNSYTSGTTTGTTTSTPPTTGLSLEATQTGISGKLTTISDKLAPPTATDNTTATGNMGTSTTAYDNAVSQINTPMTLANDAPAGFKEKTNITTTFDGIIANNPISSILNNSGVVLTGSQPYLSWEYNGKNILLRVDQFDNELSAFGSILLAFTTLSGLVMLFSRS